MSNEELETATPPLDPIPMDVLSCRAAILRDAAKRHGTVKQLTEEAGISLSFWFQLLNHTKRASEETAKKLAELLGDPVTVELIGFVRVAREVVVPQIPVSGMDLGDLRAAV